MKLIGIGDNVVDYYQDQSMMYPGGNALNVAVAAKRNGAEHSAYLGLVGDDEAGHYVLKCLQSEGIETARMRRAYGPNACASVALNEAGDRIFTGTNREVRVQSLLSLRLTKGDLDYINGFDVIHTSVNSSIEHELPSLSHKSVSFDFSTKQKWTFPYLQAVCPHLTYAFFSGADMNDDEISRLVEETLVYGVKVVGITKGSEPAMFFEHGQMYRQPPLPAHVVDTMGAGDSFIGSFLASYHEHRDMVEALRKAAYSASVTCGFYGSFGYGTQAADSVRETAR